MMKVLTILGFEKKIEYNNDAFSLNQFGQNLFFLQSVIFLKFLGGIEEKALSIRQSSKYS